MQSLKTYAEAFDILVKLALAIAAFLFVDKAKQSFELQKSQAELQRVQVETLKLQAEHSRIQAEQTKILADAQSVTRKDDAALVQLIVELLFKQNATCRTEDQMVLIHFLGEMNDSYNKVKLGPAFAGAFGKRRECALNEAVQADAKAVKTSNDGEIPLLEANNVNAVIEPLLNQDGFKHAMGTEFKKHHGEGAIGYVALGVPLVGSNGFTNFELLRGERTKNYDVTDGSLMRTTTPVFVRANRRSTDDGHNPILGRVADHRCVTTIDAFPDTRGQTWALVKLADCPPRVKTAAASGQ